MSESTARPAWMHTGNISSKGKGHITGKGKGTSTPAYGIGKGGLSKKNVGHGKGNIGSRKRRPKDYDLRESVDSVSESAIRNVAAAAGIKRMQAAFVDEVRWGMIYPDIEQVVEAACMYTGCDGRAIVKAEDMIHGIQNARSDKPANFYPTE